MVTGGTGNGGKQSKIYMAVSLRGSPHSSRGLITYARDWTGMLAI